MPRLYRRQDGGYYTKSSVGDDRHTTLQIHRDGVRFLQQRGIVDGSEIGKRYMSELWRNGWISTSRDNPVSRGASSRPSSPILTTSAYNSLAVKNRLPPSVEQTSFWNNSDNKPSYVEWEQQVLDEHFRAKYGSQQVETERRSSVLGSSDVGRHQSAPPWTTQSVTQTPNVDCSKPLYVLAGIGIGSMLWWLLERVF